MDKMYIYGFEISKLNDNHETDYSLTIKLDVPFLVEFKESETWDFLQKTCKERFKITEKSFDDYCLFTCFYSDFAAEYDQAFLSDLREEYCGSITIQNEYDQMSKVLNAR